MTSSSNSSSTWTSYLRWMVASAITIIGAVGLFNVLIDPLGVFPVPRLAGINAIKPYLDHHRELARYQRAVRLCPDTGIFGNSRAEIGFDPESGALRAHGLSAFNHAIPATRAGSTLRQLLWLQAANCMPKNIILGVEFFDFLGGTVPHPLPTLASAPAPELDKMFFAQTVLSITGLRDSLSTLFLQKSRYPATITDRGFNPLLNYIAEVAQSGHYVLFRQRAEENLRSWARKPPRLRVTPDEASDDETNLDAILEQAQRADSTVYVVIYPYHAEIRLIMERLGLGKLFADWKRKLIDKAERSVEQGGKIQVWDFSSISPETLEAIPAKGDTRTQLAHYWEAGHFKRELGEQMLARLLGGPGSFGIRLDSRNLESSLAEDNRRVRALVAADTPLGREVNDLFAHDKAE